MTESETLPEQNQLLLERLAVLEAAAQDSEHLRMQETERLQARIEELEAHSRTVDPSPLPPTRSSSPFPTLALKDVKLDLPPEFEGKPTEYASFIGHCEFYFDNKPSMFLNNDKNKVSLVISCLRSRAATWVHALRRTEPRNPIFISWPLFYAELSSLFEDTYHLEQMHREYDALEQKGSARAFAAEFKALATILHKSDSDKIFDFKKKLKPTVKTGLTIATIDNFDMLVAKAIELDQVLFENAKAAKKAEQPKKAGATLPSAPHPQQPRNNNASSSHHGPRNSSSTQNPVPSSGPHPRLTAEEKQRRETLHLCRVCGSSDHFKKDCPVHQAKENKNKGSSRYSTPAVSSNVNANPDLVSAAPVTVSHIISSSSPGKYNPQGQ